MLNKLYRNGIVPDSKTSILNIKDLRNLPVSEIISPAMSVEPEFPLPKVIGYLREHNLYEVFIDEKDRTGIVTLRALLDVQNIITTKLSTVASSVPRLALGNTLGDAAALMFEYRIRSMPVYEKGNLKGQITSNSIIEKLMEVQPNFRGDRLMTADPICVDVGDDVGKARRTMIRRKIDQLPVTKDGKLYSAVTSSTIVFNMIPQADRQPKGNRRSGRYEASVEDFTSETVVQNEASDLAKDIFQNMKRNIATYSVITNFDEIQGITTHRDFMKMIMNTRDPSYIPMYIVGLPDDPFEAEATREKFTRVIRLVQKAVPDLMEARAIIKSGQTKAAKKRFRVQVFIATPTKRYNYTETGFELADVFDEISNWARKLAERDDSYKRRVRVDPGSLAYDTAR